MLDIYWSFIHFKLGSEREIRFWEDRWVGEAPLKVSFGSLYCLAVDSRAFVVESFDELINIWMPCYKKNLNDWEMGDMCRLYA